VIDRRAINVKVLVLVDFIGIPGHDYEGNINFHEVFVFFNFCLAS
jgi:hypothetical protein